MEIKITKADGTGNDFIIIYNNVHHDLIKPQIQNICAQFKTDGLLLISDYKNYDYKMDYFNNDGSWETMCANGARCAALFMFTKNLVNQNIAFMAGDGAHQIEIDNPNKIKLSMRQPVFKSTDIISCNYKGRYVDSGAKHFATIANVNNQTVKIDGQKIRNDQQFPDGINVNFMNIINSQHIKVFTYEKGIEDMVLSCGSGSVAAAFYAFKNKKIKSPLKISVPGGELTLTFNETWDEVWLSGPAKLYPETTWTL